MRGMLHSRAQPAPQQKNGSAKPFFQGRGVKNRRVQARPFAPPPSRLSPWIFNVHVFRGCYRALGPGPAANLQPLVAALAANLYRGVPVRLDFYAKGILRTG